jgi:hypothetical protein
VKNRGTYYQTRSVHFIAKSDASGFPGSCKLFLRLMMLSMRLASTRECSRETTQFARMADNQSLVPIFPALDGREYGLVVGQSF